MSITISDQIAYDYYNNIICFDRVIPNIIVAKRKIKNLPEFNSIKQTNIANIYLIFNKILDLHTNDNKKITNDKNLSAKIKNFNKIFTSQIANIFTTRLQCDNVKINKQSIQINFTTYNADIDSSQLNDIKFTYYKYDKIAVSCYAPKIKKFDDKFKHIRNPNLTNHIKKIIFKTNPHYSNRIYKNAYSLPSNVYCWSSLYDLFILNQIKNQLSELFSNDTHSLLQDCVHKYENSNEYKTYKLILKL